MFLTEIDIKNQISELTEFEIRVKRELNISNVEHKIEFGYVKSGEYHEQNVFAQAKHDEEYNFSGIIIYCLEVIAKGFNFQFGQIFNRDVLDRILEIYLKILIAHELFHVKQLYEKTYSIEEYKREYLKPPSQRRNEIEADDFAYTIVENEGRCDKLIAKIIKGSKAVNYERAKTIIALYHKAEK